MWTHIKTICSKLSKNVGLFNKLKHFLPPEVMKSLYHPHVHPYLNYSIESCYGTSLVSTSRASVLQEKAIRVVYILPYNYHTNDWFKTSKILKIKDLYNLNLCNYLFHSNAPDINSYISKSLEPHSAFHNYNTCKRNNLVVPRFGRSWSQSSFLYRSVREFNRLPHEIKINRSLNVFMSKLKNHCSGY